MDYLILTLEIGFAGSIIYVVLVLNRCMQLRHVSVTPVDWNNDDSTRTNFLELLKAASESMIVYDDGNKQDGSIYMNREFVDTVANAVREKREKNADFGIRFLFNSDDPELLFRKRLAGHAGIEIRINPPHGRRLKTQYKIIDGGKQAYLSQHPFGASNRRFKRVDCSRVPKRYFKKTSDAVLGSFSRHFEKAFPAALQ